SISSSLAIGARRPGARERPGEAQFVPVRVGQVEELLAPGGIRGSGVGFQARGTGVEGVHVRDVEDHPAPPRSSGIGGPSDQVQVVGTRMQAGEGSLLTAGADGEAQGAMRFLTYRRDETEAAAIARRRLRERRRAKVPGNSRSP